jgi:cytidyltransferase-like protein
MNLINEADKPVVKKTVVVYAGRFQPFHKGHYDAYKRLVSKFGESSVYIGTSNDTSSDKSPFSFKEKKEIATKMFGIPANRFVKVNNPYKPVEILSKFNGETTQYIAAVGEKDATRLQGKYFKPYKDKAGYGYDEIGYTYPIPAEANPISGTDVRKGLGSGNEEKAKKFFLKAYPKFDKEIFKMITTKLTEGFPGGIGTGLVLPGGYINGAPTGSVDESNNTKPSSEMRPEPHPTRHEKEHPSNEPDWYDNENPYDPINEIINRVVTEELFEEFMANYLGEKAPTSKLAGAIKKPKNTALDQDITYTNAQGKQAKIKAKSALRLPKDHPAHIAAAKLVGPDDAPAGGPKKPAMPPVPGNKPKMPPVPGNKPKMPPVPGKTPPPPPPALPPVPGKGDKPKMPPVPGQAGAKGQPAPEPPGKLKGADFATSAEKNAEKPKMPPVPPKIVPGEKPKMPPVPGKLAGADLKSPAEKPKMPPPPPPPVPKSADAEKPADTPTPETPAKQSPAEKPKKKAKSTISMGTEPGTYVRKNDDGTEETFSIPKRDPKEVKQELDKEVKALHPEEQKVVESHNNPESPERQEAQKNVESFAERMGKHVGKFFAKKKEQYVQTGKAIKNLATGKKMGTIDGPDGKPVHHKDFKNEVPDIDEKTGKQKKTWYGKAKTKWVDKPDLTPEQQKLKHDSEHAEHQQKHALKHTGMEIGMILGGVAAGGIVSGHGVFGALHHGAAGLAKHIGVDLAKHTTFEVMGIEHPVAAGAAAFATSFIGEAKEETGDFYDNLLKKVAERMKTFKLSDEQLLNSIKRFKAKEYEKIKNTNVSDTKKENIEHFVEYATKRLKLKETPKINLITGKEYADAKTSLGGYNPDSKEIFVVVGGRLTADILRTIAHEMVHRKQDEMGLIRDNVRDGADGSPVENNAHAVAGILMREYGRINKKIYNENINVDVDKGDTVLMGKFKNKKVVVKDLGKDGHGMPTINGKVATTFRMGDKGQNVFDKEENVNEMGSNDIHFKNIVKYYDKGGPNIKKQVSLVIAGNKYANRNRIVGDLRNMGYEEIRGIEKKLGIEDLFEKKNLNESLLLEGGAYGHMSHPFDDMDLSFGDLKNIITKALEGDLGVVREKTDGQALAISWKNGRLIAARNKGHLAGAGANAMGIEDVASKFSGRGGLTDAYNFAMKDLSAAISSLSDAQRKKIFNEGGCFMNLEVIWPTSVNVIPYGQALLVFHNTVCYDIDGNPIAADNGAASTLAGMIKQVNADVQEKYTIQGPPITSIPKNENLSSKQGKYISKLKKLQSEFKLNDSSTMAEYHQAWWENFVNKSKVKLQKLEKEALVRRWAFGNKSFRLNTIADKTAQKWAIENDKVNVAKQQKDNMKPFEEIFLGVGADVLEFVGSVLTVHPDKAIRAMKEKFKSVAAQVRSGGDPSKIAKLKQELSRLNDLGGINKIVATEGIVFFYGGKTYKLTGTFAPLNQILGIFYE